MVNGGGSVLRDNLAGEFGALFGNDQVNDMNDGTRSLTVGLGSALGIAVAFKVLAVFDEQLCRLAGIIAEPRGCGGNRKRRVGAFFIGSKC